MTQDIIISINLDAVNTGKVNPDESYLDEVINVDALMIDEYVVSDANVDDWVVETAEEADPFYQVIKYKGKRYMFYYQHPVLLKISELHAQKFMMEMNHNFDVRKALEKTERFFIGDKTLGDLLNEDRMIEPPPVKRKRSQRARNPSLPGIKIKEVKTNDSSSSMPKLAITDKGKGKMVEENSTVNVPVNPDVRQVVDPEIMKANSARTSEYVKVKHANIDDGGYEQSLRSNPDKNAFTSGHRLKGTRKEKANYIY